MVCKGVQWSASFLKRRLEKCVVGRSEMDACLLKGPHLSMQEVVANGDELMEEKGYDWLFAIPRTGHSREAIFLSRQTTGFWREKTADAV